ncbi:MAG: MBL fold metallo-hydrolase [Thermoleophilia bacterium]|nr:MBL fold metallo-hydrolase [Thermoleophilia bacterium]
MSEPEATPESEAVIAKAADQGVHLVAVPTPFAVGRVNCYLLEGDPLTLIDAGPRSDRSLERLESGIEAAGHKLEDIELVVATHQHIDHIGLIGTVADRSGAEVAAIDISVDRLASFTFGSERDDDLAVDLMVRNGVPHEIAKSLKELTASFRDWGSPVTVTQPVAQGDKLRMGSRDYEVFLRPGHSPSDTLFWDAERGLMFAGDHLLSHISSNPLISKPLVGEGVRTRALIDYRKSLAQTKTQPVELMLSGHGLPITDHADLIDKRVESQDRRSEKIYGLVAQGNSTAHSIAEAIWGNIALTQAYLTLSEVIGHLDILVEEGRVTVVSDGEFDRFEVAG